MSRLDRWAQALVLAYGEPRRTRGRAGLAPVEVLKIIDTHLDAALRRAASVGEPREVVERWVAQALAGPFSVARPEGAALRLALLELVEEGAMRPSEAERRAKLLGWPSLAGWADPTDFDPMTEREWTLAMAAAWIRWRPRAIEQVRRHWPVYRDVSTGWVRSKVGGFEIGRREDCGYWELDGETTDTKQQLLAALRDGRLKATRMLDGEIVPIAPGDWSRLAIVGRHDPDGVHHVVMREEGSASSDLIRYSSVRVPRADILKVFPEATDEEHPARRGRLSEAEVRRLLDEVIKRIGDVPGQKVAVEIVSSHGSFSRDRLREILKELAPDREQGRPRKARP